MLIQQQSDARTEFDLNYDSTQKLSKALTKIRNDLWISKPWTWAGNRGRYPTLGNETGGVPWDAVFSTIQVYNFMFKLTPERSHGLSGIHVRSPRLITTLVDDQILHRTSLSLRLTMIGTDVGHLKSRC